MKLDENKPYYTTREVAKLTGLTPAGVAETIRYGNLKAGKHNNSYIITREALIEYLEKRERRDK